MIVRGELPSNTVTLLTSDVPEQSQISDDGHTVFDGSSDELDWSVVHTDAEHQTCVWENIRVCRGMEEGRGRRGKVVKDGEGEERAERGESGGRRGRHKEMV